MELSQTQLALLNRTLLDWTDLAYSIRMQLITKVFPEGVKVMMHDLVGKTQKELEKSYVTPKAVVVVKQLLAENGLSLGMDTKSLVLDMNRRIVN